MNSYILTIDIGTSSCKAALFSEDGKFLALGKGKYPLLFPQEGYVEQDPDAVFQGMCEAVEELGRQGYALSGVKAISFSAQIASQCLVDTEGRPLTRLLSWMDTRAAKETEEFGRLFSREETEKLTGVDMIVTPAYSITKLLWLRNHRKELVDRAWKFVQIKDYVIWKLTGNWVSDATSMKGLVHPRTKETIPEILNYIGIPKSLLPQVKEPNEIAGYLNRKEKAFEEIPEGTPVITGWNDMNAAFLGMGALTEGYVGMDLTGTSEHLGCIGPYRSRSWDSYSGVNRVPYLEDREVFYGVTSSGGQAVEWFVKDFIEAPDVAGYLMELLGEGIVPAPELAEDLIFLPYLEGERNPWNNPQAGGVFFGLKRNSGQRDAVLAVLEGVCFALRAIYDRLPEKPERVIVSGGASSNHFWNQMKADVMNVPFVRLENTEAGCVGAAILALSALSPEKSMEKLSAEILHPAQEYIPDENRHRIYEKRYRKFLKLYHCLDKAFWNKEGEQI